MLEGVVVVDREGAVELLNAEACRILETSPQHASGAPVERIAGPHHALAKLTRAVLASGRAAVESDQLMERRFDEDLIVDVAASPLFESDRGVSGVVVVLRDRTIQRGLQEVVSERERLRGFGRFAAGIAHEVRNPLGGIRGAAELLSARAGDESTRDAARLIVREVERIAVLVDDLMVLSQDEAVRLREVNIHRILDDVLDLLAMDPLAAGVRVERRFDPSIPELAGDGDRLVQVFLNLCRNALQALEGEGTLAIGTRMSLDHRIATQSGETLPTLLVSVEDDGPGIDPGLLDQLDTPLYTTRVDGTGLGLSVARHWVARHGGTLRIESRPGEGTCVRVALPVQRRLEGRPGGAEVSA
jgi:two-component system nitrogen regulation sensor histidine kinase GlnL